MAGKPPIAHSGVFRIISEYPNLAELYALKARLRRFSIFPVWGAAEVYPPENAELTLVAARTENELFAYGIMPVSKVLNFSAFLIANRHSWQSKNLDGIVTTIFNLPEVETKAPPQKIVKPERIKQYSTVEDSGEDIRLALPDGHQQQPTQDLLNRADIQVDDYPSEVGNRRPEISIEGVKVKVVRPQDMPLQVANGNFHLAITGRDWLREHLYQFTSSPVKELLDLKYGKVRLVAVVSNDLSIADIDGLRHLIASRGEPFRVASEYVNIADRFARDNHLGRYRVIPTWGATEAFLPEDADLLIENTQTGRTIARHNLKILNILFESTACLIGHAGNNYNAAKKERIKSIIERLRRAVEGTFS